MCRIANLLTTLRTKLVVFDYFKDNNDYVEDFRQIWEKCSRKEGIQDFHKLNGFLFRGNQLCSSRLSQWFSFLRKTTTDFLLIIERASY